MTSRYGRKMDQELASGLRRKLTRSECDRGYFFVTKATWRRDYINEGDFTLIFNGHRFAHRRLDAYGRTRVGKRFLSQFEPGTMIDVRLVSRDLLHVDTS